MFVNFKIQFNELFKLIFSVDNVCDNHEGKGIIDIILFGFI